MKRERVIREGVIRAGLFLISSSQVLGADPVSHQDVKRAIDTSRDKAVVLPSDNNPNPHGLNIQYPSSDEYPDFSEQEKQLANPFVLKQVEIDLKGTLISQKPDGIIQEFSEDEISKVVVDPGYLYLLAEQVSLTNDVLAKYSLDNPVFYHNIFFYKEGDSLFIAAVTTFIEASGRKGIVYKDISDFAMAFYIGDEDKFGVARLRDGRMIPYYKNDFVQDPYTLTVRESLEPNEAFLMKILSETQYEVLEPITFPQGITAKKGTVNIRQKPSTKDPVLAVLKESQKQPVLGVVNTQEGESWYVVPITSSSNGETAMIPAFVHSGVTEPKGEMAQGDIQITPVPLSIELVKAEKEELDFVPAKAKVALPYGMTTQEGGVKLYALPDPTSAKSEKVTYIGNEVTVIGRSQDLKYFLIENKRGEVLGWIEERYLNFFLEGLSYPENQAEDIKKYSLPIYVIKELPNGEKEAEIVDPESLIPRFDEENEKVEYIQRGGKLYMVLTSPTGSQEIEVKRLSYSIGDVTYQTYQYRINPGGPLVTDTRERIKAVFLGLVEETYIQGIEAYVFAVDILSGPYKGRNYFVLPKQSRSRFGYSSYNPQSLGGLILIDVPALVKMVQKGDEIILEQVYQLSGEPPNKADLIWDLSILVYSRLNGELSYQGKNPVVPVTIYGSRQR